MKGQINEWQTVSQKLNIAINHSTGPALTAYQFSQIRRLSLGRLVCVELPVVWGYREAYG